MNKLQKLLLKVATGYVEKHTPVVEEVVKTEKELIAYHGVELHKLTKKYQTEEASDKCTCVRIWWHATSANEVEIDVGACRIKGEITDEEPNIEQIKFNI